eukprot:TRINITY_DN4536_c0_g1_i1.p1 TRINITY_DN4536_c0_g1~~TRINITY_DN4536_c0_g1_i1.p1  ORF type:complete len:580 (+),score=140.94 TRINITY_DN4536_c0_g1_i1:99-1838(+)
MGVANAATTPSALLLLLLALLAALLPRSVSGISLLDKRLKGILSKKRDAFNAGGGRSKAARKHRQQWRRLAARSHAALAKTKATKQRSAREIAVDKEVDFALSHATVSVEQCAELLRGQGCAWTRKWHCPDQHATGSRSPAKRDGSVGFACCCDLGLWQHSSRSGGAGRAGRPGRKAARKPALRARAAATEALRGAAKRCAATHGSVAAGAKIEGNKCNWTDTYSCKEQYLQPTWKKDADHFVSPHEYTCCCVLGYWRKPVEAALVSFGQRVEEMARCEAHVARTHCAFTERWACPQQQRSPDAKAKPRLLSAARSSLARADGSEAFRCCCELEFYRVPQQLAAASDAPVFLHIPKNAGTAIERTSEAHGLSYPKRLAAFRKGVWMPDGSLCEKYHVPPQYLQALGEPAADVAGFRTRNTYCVTRHPYERAVSEYLYQLSVKWGRQMSAQYRTGLFSLPRCTAESLNHFLQDALRKVAEGRKFLHDCHFVPQHEFIFGRDGTRWCKHVLRHSEFPQVFNDFMRTTGYAPRLAAERPNNSTRACGNVSVADLSAETIRLLDDVYDQDFKLLNYTKHADRA